MKATPELQPLRLALGLRSTAQSLGVIGRDSGIFAACGLDLQIVREETAGPEGARGLLADEYDMAEFGVVPLVQAVYEGRDPVILLAAEQVSAMCLWGAAGVARGTDLAGRRIGVLTIAGQTGVSCLQMLARWGLSAGDVTLVELGTYPEIYRALQEGRIEGGVLTADYGIAGSVAFQLSMLADLGAELRFQGPIVATTRRYAAEHPDRVRRAVRAYVQTLDLFRQAPERVAPSIERHLGFVDAEQARAVQAFYAARFQAEPHPSADGIQKVIDLYAPRYPQRQPLALEDVWDRRFLDEVMAERGAAGTERKEA